MEWPPPGTDDELLRAGMATAARLAEEWGLTLGEQLPGASSSLIVEAGEDCVLRIPVRGEEIRSGYQAQLAFAHCGGVPILRHDPETCATLMPRLRPGTMLSDASLTPEDDVLVACSVIAQFDVETIPQAVRIEDWYEPFFEVNAAQGIPGELLVQAQRVAGRLLGSMSKRRLFHGDLHHFNLLLSGSQWVAIDPQGILSELEFEPAAFLRNPCTTIHATADLPGLMRLRIDAFAECLGVDAGRIRDWGIAQNVLSAWWDPPDQRAPTLKVVHAIQRAFDMR